MKSTVSTKTCKLVSMSIPISLQMGIKSFRKSQQNSLSGRRETGAKYLLPRPKLHNDNFSVKSQHLALMTNGRILVNKDRLPLSITPQKILSVAVTLDYVL